MGMEVKVTKGPLGWATFHIFDHDGREIALNRSDAEALADMLEHMLKAHPRGESSDE